MNEPAQKSRGEIKCVICLCSPSTTLSFTTPIDVEGTQIYCGVMYTRFIGLEDDAIGNISHNDLKLCLICFTKLNTCYVFQQQAIKSSKHLLDISFMCNNTIVSSTSENGPNCDETIVEFNSEIVHVDCVEGAPEYGNIGDQIQDAYGTNCLEVRGETETDPSVRGTCNEETFEEEYLVESDEFEQNINNHQWKPEECSSSYSGTGCTDSQVDNIEPQEDWQDDKVEAGKELRNIATVQVEPCASCVQSRHHMPTLRHHFLESHCMRKTDNQLHCTMCQRNFKSRKTYIQHLPIHQSYSLYACRFCSQSFRYHHHQKRHELTHSKEKPYGCKLCPKAFPTKHDLRNHIAQHNEMANNKCDVCSVRFKTLKSLKIHKLKQHDQVAKFFEPYACEHCGKMLYSQTAATYHANYKCNKQSTEAGTFFIRCAICKRQFGTRTQLETHLEAEHTTEEQQIVIEEDGRKSVYHECDVCGRRFSQGITLRRHKLRHEGIKPYQCDHCQRRFTQKGTLKTHLRTHTNEKPYLCPVCGDSFRSAGTLRNHRIRRCGIGES